MPTSDRRICHWLRPNIRSSVPSQLVFVDTETLPRSLQMSEIRTIHDFRLGYAIACRLEEGQRTRRKDFPFLRAIEFWEWLDTILNPRRQTWLFAHSVGFDLTVLGLWGLIESGHFRLADIEDPEHIDVTEDGQVKRGWTGMLVAEDPPTIISLRRGDAGLVIVDTRNYWPASLANLGLSVGCPKYGWSRESEQLMEQRSPTNQTGLDRIPPWDIPDNVWMEYCRRDTEIIFRAVTELCLWWQEKDLGSFRYTAPGLAWNAFRHRFMQPKSILISDGSDCPLSRQAYYGGEVRCFYVGPVHSLDNWAFKEMLIDLDSGSSVPYGPLYELDVTSLYPSVMRENKFPSCLIGAIPVGNLPRLEKEMQRGLCIAEVVLRTEEDTYPVRITDEGDPVHMEQGEAPNIQIAYRSGKTRFARGTFTTYLCHPELARAIKHGHVIGVGPILTYWGEELFKDFVDYFWSGRRVAKNSGREVQANFYKLIMNSLSGKWAQRKGVWSEEPEAPCITPWGQWLHGFDSEGRLQKYRAIATHVQRYTQGEEGIDSFPAISAFITSYGREVLFNLRKIAGQGNVYYQDTDSLHVNHAGYTRLQDAGRIGQSDLGKLRLKDTATSGNYFGLKHYRFGDSVICGAIRRGAERVGDTEYEYTQFHSLAHTLCRKPDPVICEVKIRKKVSLCHPDGRVKESGWVEPLTL